MNAGRRTPQMNTVMECLRAFLPSWDDTCLRTALETEQDWAAVDEIASLHNVAPIVSSMILRHGSGFVPAEVLERSKDSLKRVVRTNLLWLQEWQQLLRTLEEAAIPVISFKGPALALMAYGDLGLREFHDLDLLVHPRDVPRAKDILTQAGYGLWSPLRTNSRKALLLSKNRQLRFTNSSRRTCVDLHWGLLHEMYSFQLDIDLVFRAAHKKQCEETEFLSLSAEYLLLYLCAHGTKECWPDLRTLCDVAVFIHSKCELDWDCCFRLSRKNKCDTLLRHALLLCEEIWPSLLPDDVRIRCVQDREALDISLIARRFLFVEQGTGPGHLQMMRYHLSFAKSWRDRWKLIFIRVFTPAEPDWKRVRLPASLSALYYFVRPARFLQELGTKLVGLPRRS